jgi:hypothetical protein
MKSPFSILRRLLGQQRDNNVLQIFTPTIVADRSVGTRLVLAGATVMGLGIFTAIALGAFVTLLLALGAIYFLVTQVLGIRLDVDPQVIMQRAQEYAGYSQRN